MMKNVPIRDSGMAIDGDDHGAHGGEEQENHGRHDQQGLDEGGYDLADRAVHVPRGVIDDPRVQALGQLRLDRRERIAHVPDHREQVGAGRHLDPDVDGALPVEGHGRVIVFRAEGDLGHVAQPDDGPVDLPDHQVAELLDACEGPWRR